MRRASVLAATLLLSTAMSIAAAAQDETRAALARGMQAYEAGDFQAALNWWQQAAAAGSSDAHYNLGLLMMRDPQQASSADSEFEAAAREQHVLFCFALGTRLAPQDQAAARQWLECAARQGYAPAQFNLATLYARASIGPEDQDAAKRWYAAAAATYAPAATALAALAQAPAASSTNTATSTLALRDEAWVMAQPAASYTVQIASGSSAEVLESLLRDGLQEGDAACVHERPSSRQPYSAIVGVYANRDTAERAVRALPAALRVNGPWVRRYSSLQQALRDADKETQAGAAAHAVSN